MTFFQAIILAIVEGLTEFLPVSSTGHLIITSSLMGIAEQDFTKVFTVAIQFGAILSVVVMYWRKFVDAIDLPRIRVAAKMHSVFSASFASEFLGASSFYVKLFIAFLPAAFFGKLLNDYIDALLENVTVVAISLILGGIILVFVDKWFIKNETSGTAETTNASALKIGLFQCLAMIPGVSRSAATIIGGLTQNMTRKAAAEFSFFLAIPTMFAATAYKLLKFYMEGSGFQNDELLVLLVGNVAAFFVAIVAIKGFISILTKYGFRAFGFYRILLGCSILLLQYLGYQLVVG